MIKTEYSSISDANRQAHIACLAFDQANLQPSPLPQSTAQLPTELEQTAFTHAGLTLDAMGRPLHPWLTDMATDPGITLAEGKGSYYYWGSNYTVDPIVICKNAVLLIRRQDTGAWALPGGFVDANESAKTAGVRELEEETGVVLPKICTPKVVYTGPVADVRTTKNAWPETTALLYVLNDILEYPKVYAASDAADACWQPIASLPTIHLYGSHALLIKQALTTLDQNEASN